MADGYEGSMELLVREFKNGKETSVLFTWHFPFLGTGSMGDIIDKIKVVKMSSR